MSEPEAICRCGHAFAAHDHLRRGTDCATCGPAVCPSFRRPRTVAARALLGRVARRGSGGRAG